MIPLRDVIPSRTFPFVNIALITLNAVAFLAELSISTMPFSRSFGISPWCPGAFLWTTVLTSMFIHAGWLHFLGNMLYLWIFGDNVEDRLGHFRYLLFYLVCGMVAGWRTCGSTLVHGAHAGRQRRHRRRDGRVLRAVSALADPHADPTVHLLHADRGSAGHRVSWHLVRDPIPQRRCLGRRESGGVAVWAHVAGFLAGAAWVLVFRARRTRWD
jgi:membrane associated rhomboid family serine protease